jgi:hypothetical protein
MPAQHVPAAGPPEGRRADRSAGPVGPLWTEDPARLPYGRSRRLREPPGRRTWRGRGGSDRSHHASCRERHSHARSIAVLSVVSITISDRSVRCTGHRSAISVERFRWSSSRAPSNWMTRSIRSIRPVFVSQSVQSLAWTRLCRSATVTSSSGHCLRCAYSVTASLRRARTEPGEQQVVGRRTGVVPYVHRFVGNQVVRADGDVLGEGARPRAGPIGTGFPTSVPACLPISPT